MFIKPDVLDEQQEKLDIPYKVERSFVPSYDALPVSMKVIREKHESTRTSSSQAKNFSTFKRKLAHWVYDSSLQNQVCEMKWKSTLTLVSKCSNVVERKDASGVKHVRRCTRAFDVSYQGMISVSSNSHEPESLSR